MDKNIEREKEFNQVCIWPATLIGQDKIEEFKNFMKDTFDVRIQYLEEIKTFPDKDDPKTGGRNDVFFSVHNDDIGKFSVPRLSAGIRWIEDVLSKGNYRDPIYPKRVFKYKTW